jgi:CVNH domain
MRYLTMFGMLALAAALWVPGACAAQIPGGSYQQTCRDIGVRGSTLYATCQNAGGGWQASELRDFQRCNGEIQNVNGSLQCAAGNVGYNRGRDGDHDHDGDHDRNGDHRWPRGSYAQTCQNISISGDTLQASCQKKNGSWRQTSLRHYDRCNADIANNNGKLKCLYQ